MHALDHMYACIILYNNSYTHGTSTKLLKPLCQSHSMYIIYCCHACSQWVWAMMWVWKHLWNCLYHRTVKRSAHNVRVPKLCCAPIHYTIAKF